MEIQELLIGLAQIAVALVGFSGLASVFRRSGDDTWRPDVRFWSLIIATIGCLIFSLLPLAFLHGGMSSIVTWSACSGIFAAFMTVSWIAFLRELRRRIGAGEYYKSAITVAFTVGHVIAVAVLVLNTLGIAWRPTFAPYLASLMLYFLWASMILIRMIYMGVSASK